MRRFLLAGAAMAGLTLAAASAHATDFVLQSIDVTAQTSDPGLTVVIANQASNLDINLGVTNPQTFELFDIYTNESTLNSDDFAYSDISVSFDFSAPTPIAPGDGDGHTSGGIVPGTPIKLGRITIPTFDQAGILTWENGGVVNVPFGNGLTGLMQITLTGGAFNQGNLFGLDKGPGYELPVYATFDWVNDPTAAPEPATWALMISGFGLAGAGLRRRRAVAATA